MGGFQFQKPIRQKLLSKQQRGPYPNGVGKQKVAPAQSLRQVRQPRSFPLAEVAWGVLFQPAGGSSYRSTWTSRSVIKCCIPPEKQSNLHAVAYERSNQLPDFTPSRTTF